MSLMSFLLGFLVLRRLVGGGGGGGERDAHARPRSEKDPADRIRHKD